MSSNDWLSKSEAQILVQHDEYSLKIGSYAATFGLSLPQLGQIASDNAWLHRAITGVASFKDEANEWVSFKNRLFYGDPSAGGLGGGLAEPTTPSLGAAPAGMLENIIGRWRAQVQFLKNHPNYTPAIGQDLGIVGPAVTGATKPSLAAKDLGGGQAEVDGNKDIYDGLNIYTQRAGETVWTFLARDNFLPYVDNRPLLVPNQPEERRFRAKFVDNDLEVGEWSDTVSVVVSP